MLMNVNQYLMSLIRHRVFMNLSRINENALKKQIRKSNLKSLDW